MASPPPPLPGWDESCTVGVPELDDQHRRLFRALEGLRASLQGRGSALEGLEGLLRDCAEHFADEEQLLARVGYPRAVQQRVQHRVFLGRVRRLAEGVRGGTEAVGEGTVGGLAAWFRGHVCGLDREYGEWLRGRGRE
ncbi:MAG: hemerythrin family protein [Deferrisomatales bacterium]|nr:hemerythrin family protein [Deferrisomatales bacterium]